MVNDSSNTVWPDVEDNATNETTVSTLLHYPPAASYFAAVCAILFVVVGITGKYENAGVHLQSV